MAGKGRTAGFKMTDEHRSKIANSKILSNLIRYAEGDEDIVSASQAQVGLALLKKVMADLQTVDGDTGSSAITIYLPEGARGA